MYLKENSFFNNFLKINFFLYLIVIAGDAASYLYQILNAKFFEVEVFGLFNKFTYSTIFFTSPIASLQLILVRYISSKKKVEENDIKTINTLFIYSLLFVTLFLLLFFNYFRTYFNDLLICYIFIIYVYTILINQYLISFYQGLRNYITHSFIGASGLFLKVFLLVVLLFSPLKQFSNFISLVLALLISNVICIFFILKQIPNYFSFKIIKVKELFEILRKINISHFFAPFITLIFFSSDIFLISNISSNKEIGLISSASVIGKIVFFLCSISLMYLLPASSFSKSNEELSKNKMQRNLSIGIVLLIFVTSTLFIYYFRESIIFVTYNSQYMAASQYVLVYCIAFGLIALNNNFLTYLISINHERFTTKPILLLLTYLLVSYFLIDTPIQIIKSLILVNLLISIYLSFVIFKQK